MYRIVCSVLALAACGVLLGTAFGETPQQGGDTCALALVVGGLPFSASGTTCGYANDYDVACPYANSTAPDVVYAYTPAANETVDITLCTGPTDYDSKLYIYEDTCPGTVTGCNDDACSSPVYSSYVSQLLGVPLAVGHTYYIIVDGYGPFCGNYYIDITAVPPSGCQHRVDLWDCYGDGWNGNTLDVLVNGTAVLSGITLAGGAGPESHYFAAATGDTIQTIYNPIGGWSYEPYYFIYDGLGNLLGSDGISGGNCYVQPTGITVIGNCEVPTTGACCYYAGGCALLPEADCVDGLWLGLGHPCSECPCLVPCPPGGVPEAEVCGTDTNGGCNAAGYPFEPIACGQTVCGTTWASTSLRDTDWYQLFTSEWSYFTWTAEGEVPVLIFILKPGANYCTDLVVLGSATAAECQPATLTSDCLPAGEYWFWVGPSSWSDWPCTKNYTATLICQPCTPSYCTGAGGCDEYISNVQMDVINNATACTMYGDYTALGPAVLMQGVATALMVTNGTPYYSADTCSVWVDWNHDFVFDDNSSENLGDIPGVGPYSFFVTPPPEALPGPTRMRIRIDYSNANPYPCGTTTYGEVEDYTVDVIPAGACCHPNGTCEITTEADCPWWGLWLGPGTTCDQCLPPSATVALATAAGCYHYGDTITVDVDLSGATVKVAGGQFFLEYDSAALQFVGMNPGDPPFTLEVYECSPAVFPVPPQCTPTLGLIDYAVGVPPGGQGTTADTTMARITFLALADVCSVADVVAFRSHEPPTTLTDSLGSAVPLTLADLPPLVIDSTPPVLSDCPTDSPTVECYADVPLPAPVTALDNCDGVIPVQLDEEESNPGSNCNNVITRTRTATDSCGNSSSCMQTILVNDTTLPVLSGCPTDTTVPCYADVPAPTVVTALDNCDGAIPVQFAVEESNPGSNCNNVITRTWTATDSCGNGSSCTQTITVNDTNPPVVACPPDVTVKAEAGCAGAYVTWLPATAQDNCDGALPATCTPPSGAFFAVGTTTVTCAATDSCGNTGECTFSVTVTAVNELVVTVDLDGVITTPVTRCITFVLWTCNPLSSVVAEEELTFQAGSGATRATATLDVPCGAYTCITVRDRLHTLRRTLDPLAIVGTQYVADFAAAGKPLLGGNLNDSRWIDILDFGVFMYQWNTGYDSDGDGTFDGNTTCSTAYPHADVSGDGLVTTADFTFIQTNFLLEYDANCCGQDGLRGDEAPVTRISVADLIAQGLGALAAGDVNADGWLDEQDMDAFAAGLPPPIHVGDVNCDGAVDFGDINPFVLALSNPAAWLQTYPGCNLLNADINGDGSADFADINPFIALLQQ